MGAKQKSWSLVPAVVAKFRGYHALPVTPGETARFMIQDDHGNAVDLPCEQWAVSQMNANH
ncbi:hypothetical protein GFK26_18375 [Variovorax paradoxus]|uniref:Uncharacterized protein n=1 Tax=Variovorax paradoxus TaxID=34073 RepID=A0A5Q0M7V6_VARPD|nr:hypothetical protein [Variovorax paradoxus]QFZ84595.1 hypothetical protein GFK26_18375 [Variovorax paradoxus]